MSNVYDSLLAKIAADRGWEEEEKEIFNSWRDKVAEIESNGIADRVQTSGGPGRGKYQYELADGGSGANDAARNRLKALIGDDLPGVPEEDRTELAKADPDFSKLSEDTQDALFLADKQKDAKTTLDDLVSGNISEGDAWASWHWKGAEEDLPAKLEMWDNRFDAEEPVQEEFVDLDGDIATAEVMPYEMEEETYTIQPGDNLYTIAARSGTSIEDIMRANNILEASKINAGQVLVMPKPAESSKGLLEKGYDYAKSQVLDFLR